MARALADCRRQRDRQHDVQIAGGAAGAACRNALAAQPQLSACRRSRRDRLLDIAIGRRRAHGRAERGLPRRERQIEQHIAAVDAIQAVRLEGDLEQLPGAPKPLERLVRLGSVGIKPEEAALASSASLAPV